MDTTKPITAASGSRYYVLGVLLALNVLLVLDKIVLTTLVEPIRAEFNLSDTQIGALMGLVYAMFMGLAGLPLGMLADRTSRRNLAAACITVWSLMTAACGMAQNLFQLILARIGVGIGEAGGGPAAVSMISDLFEPRRRATAMAVFAMGTQLAALVNLTIMTQVTHHFGWRVTLFAASVPGLVLALVMLLTVREPKRGGVDGLVAASTAPPLKQALGFIRRQNSLLHLLAGATIAYIIIGGMGSWHFTFLVRTHDLKLNEIGPWLGIGIAGVGIVTNLSSGFLADILGARDERRRVWVVAIGALAAMTVGAASILTDSPFWALVFVAIFAGVALFWFSIIAALTQALVEVRMRSTLAGLLFLLSNVIGYGLGPILIGMASDAIEPEFGPDSLRYAMLAVLMLNAWSALHFFLAGRSLRADMAKASAADAANAAAAAL